MEGVVKESVRAAGRDVLQGPGAIRFQGRPRFLPETYQRRKTAACGSTFLVSTAPAESRATPPYQLWKHCRQSGRKNAQTRRSPHSPGSRLPPAPGKMTIQAAKQEAKHEPLFSGSSKSYG
jgi:hypothetical protein